VQHLSEFRQLSEVKQLILKLVAFNLSTPQIAKLRQHFIDMDSDKNGTISLEELRYCVK
jgi:calcium-dependent protein kinase